MLRAFGAQTAQARKPVPQKLKQKVLRFRPPRPASLGMTFQKVRLVVVNGVAGYAATKASLGRAPFDAGFCNLMPANAVQISLNRGRQKAP
jgi:hypothetical protein